MKIKSLFDVSKLPIKMALLISLLSNGIIYIIFLLGAKQFSANPLLFYSLLPALLYLLIIPLSFPFVYKRFHGLKIEEQPFWRSWFIIFVFIILFNIIIDQLFYYVIDRSISQNYSKQLGLFLPGKNNSRILKEFSEMPFFMQNVYTNIIAISLGVLLAVILLRKINRRTGLLKEYV